jgi:hypothetical protein
MLTQKIHEAASEIAMLVPDYQNLDYDWSWYESVAKARGIERVDRFMWQDVEDGAREVIKLFMQNPAAASKYCSNIALIVESFFDHLHPTTREDIAGLMKKYVGKSTLQLIPGDEKGVELSKNLPDLYHGTGNCALPLIQQTGALLSEAQLKREGIEIMTGENSRKRLSRPCPYVCLTTEPGHVARYAFNEGIRRLSDFPVILGISKERVDALGSADEVYGFNMDRDGYEESIRVPVPVSCITHVFAPRTKMGEIAKWAEKNRIEQVCPIEPFARYHCL